MGPKEPLHAFYLELSIFAQRSYKNNNKTIHT